MKKIFKFNKYERYQIKIIKIFIICVCVIILCESLVVFPLLHGRATELYRSEKQSEINKFQTTMESTYESIRSTALRVSIDSDFAECFFRYPIVPGKNVTEELENFVSQDIQSIYIYNVFQDKVYCSNTAVVSTIENFHDSAINGYIEKGPNGEGESFVLYYRPYLEWESKDVRFEQKTFSMIFYPYNDMSVAVVVNLRPDFVNDLLKSTEMSKKGIFVLNDISGSSLFTTSATNEDEIMAFVGQFFENDKNTKMPNSVRIDNKKYSLIYDFSEPIGYHFTWLIPKSDYDAFQFFASSGLIFAITLFVLLIGVIIAFACAKRLIRPIDKLYRDVANAEKNLFLTKDGVLKKAISTVLTPNEIADFSKYSPMLNEKSVLLIKVCINNFSEFKEIYNKSDCELYRFGMMNICKELFEKYVSAETLTESDDSILIIAPDFPERNAVISECGDVLERYLETSVVFIISDPYPIEHLFEGYEQLSQLTQYRFILGDEKIISSQNCKVAQNQSYDEELSKIKQALIEQNNDELKSALTAIMNKARYFDPLQARMCFVQIAIMFINMPLCFREPLNEEKLLREIAMAETITEASEILITVGENLRVSDENIDRKNKIVNQCADIIEQEYMNIDMNVAFLADKLNITSFYLGKIFREEKGVKLSAYISDVRLEKSLELLNDKKVNVKDVASRIGFSSAEYFAVCFKKKYGLSPTQFKEHTKDDNRG